MAIGNWQLRIVNVGEEAADRGDVAQVVVLAAGDDHLGRAAGAQLIDDEGAEKAAAAGDDHALVAPEGGAVRPVVVNLRVSSCADYCCVSAIPSTEVLARYAAAGAGRGWLDQFQTGAAVMHGSFSGGSCGEVLGRYNTMMAVALS